VSKPSCIIRLLTSSLWLLSSASSLDLVSRPSIWKSMASRRPSMLLLASILLEAATTRSLPMAVDTSRRQPPSTRLTLSTLSQICSVALLNGTLTFLSTSAAALLLSIWSRCPAVTRLAICGCPLMAGATAMPTRSLVTSALSSTSWRLTSTLSPLHPILATHLMTRASTTNVMVMATAIKTSTISSTGMTTVRA